MSLKSLLVLLHIIAFNEANAQRTFVKSIDGHNRSYLLRTSHSEGHKLTNSPLIIILHPPNKDAHAAYWAALKFPSSRPAVMIFPSSPASWSCTGPLPEENRKFIAQIIDDTYDNFHIDRNRVYVLGDSTSDCFLKTLKSDTLSANIKIQAGTDFGLDPNSVIEVASTNNQAFELWQDDYLSKKMSPIDSLRGYRFHNRWVVDFQIGAGAILGSSKTGISDGTYMDLGKAKSFMTVRLSKWLNDSLACFVDAGWLKVPRKMEIDGERVKVGGGMILPLTLGAKYAIFRTSFFYPYVAMGAGMVFVMAAGGRFSPRTLAAGTPNLTYGQRYAPQFTLSSGLDMRMSKRILVGAQVRYLHSLTFQSLGNVNSIRGFSITGSVGYVINANSLKRTNLKR